MNYKKQLVWLIVISTLVRMVIAATQGLGNAEAYYWVLSTKLQWNYFDHPPIVAWLIRLSTANLLLHTELFVRLGAIVSSAICTWLMFKIGCLLSSQRAGWFAACLYSTGIYSGIGIAAFILPDSPQMVFWLSSLFMLLKIINLSASERVPAAYWCLFGMLSGLCIMCKVHGVFLWVGLALYILIYDRKHLNDRFLYLSLVIAFLIASPILVWNLQNHFATYKFHGDRVNLVGASMDLKRFAKQLFEIIFSIGPIQMFLICTGIYQAVKGRLPIDKKNVHLLLLCSLPLVLLLLIVSFFKEVLPHWPGPPLSTLLILPAISLAVNLKNQARVMPMALKLGVGYALVAGLIQVLSTNYLPGTLSDEKSGMKTGTDDMTLDLYGWHTAAIQYDSIYRSDVAQKAMPAHAPIVVVDWPTAAHIDFYMGHLTGQQTFGLGNINNLHQYFWTNNDKRPLLKGDSAYFIVPSNVFDYKVFQKVLASFKGFSFATAFSEERGGIFCKAYYIVRLTGYKGFNSIGSE